MYHRSYMGADLETTVDACMKWLGHQAETIARHPSQTLEPQRFAPDDSWSHVEALLAQSLGEDEPPLAIGETLGQGGEGIVHLAEQRSLGRMVAVKTLRPGQRSPSAAASLLREAWLLGSLEHPNIVPIHDLRRDPNGHPQAVLKRIEGTNWDDVIDDPKTTRERFDAELFEHNLEVLLQVCQAVRFAHSRGVVHRDLKPSNVMIGAFGEVYLLDWGIAVMLDAGAPWRPTVKHERGAAGTPNYMAPEMLGIGEVAISEKTDVYLLGAVLYEICVGWPPHDGDTPREVVQSILASPPNVPRHVPDDLAALLRHAMQPTPGDRPSVDEFRAALLDHRRHRTSAALARGAEEKLARLEPMADDPATSLEKAYDLFGACRFGFQQALEAWPNNPRARAGLHRAGCAMVRLELVRGDAEAARAQLETIAEPPEELRIEVNEAMAQRSVERQRIAALEHIGDQYDATTGRDTRLLLAVVIGLVWSVAPLVAIYGEGQGYKQQYPGVYAPLTYLGLMGIAYLRYRDVILRTVFNRRTFAVVGVAMVGMLVFALGAVFMGLSRTQMRTMQLLLASMATAGAAIAVDKRFWIPAAGYAAGFLACAVVLEGMAQTLLAQSVTHLITTATIYLMWRRPPTDIAERYGVRRRS